MIRFLFGFFRGRHWFYFYVIIRVRNIFLNILVQYSKYTNLDLFLKNSIDFEFINTILQKNIQDGVLAVLNQNILKKIGLTHVIILK